MLVPGAQHSYSICLYVQNDHQQSYYNIIEYNPQTVHFIPVTHLFCNWNFAPLNPPPPYFTHPPLPSPLLTTCLFSVFMSLFLFVVFVLLFLDST